MRRISYDNLWKLLIDKKLNKTELADLAQISGSTVTRMVKEETVNLESIVKICNVLGCNIGDVVELVPE